MPNVWKLRADRRMDYTLDTEAFPWNEFPRFLIRDRDQAYGAVIPRRLRAMGGSAEAP
jgi:hypothetical protein